MNNRYILATLLTLILGIDHAWTATPNWISINDHGGTASAAAPYHSTINMANAGGGTLIDMNTGSAIPGVGFTVTLNGSYNGSAGSSGAPNVGSPADTNFPGIDWNLSAIYFGAGVNTETITLTFTGLDPSKKYSIKGTAVRASNYTIRWTKVGLQNGGSSWTPAHITGSGSPGIITNGWPTYGASLLPNSQEVIYNTGINTAGDVIGWDNITGVSSFSIVNSNYLGALPNGGTANTYSYSWNTFRLEEYNSGPVVSLSSPANNTTFILPTNIVISATVSGFTNQVTNVAFYANTTIKLTDDTNSPYGYTWSNAAPGTYAITAVGKDTGGFSATSAVVNITVRSNFPPVVNLTAPAPNATYMAPANIPISANATDSDGVSNLTIYANTSVISQSPTNSLSVTWSSVAAGSYALRAVATDTLGLAATSAIVNVTVTNDSPPSVSITNPVNNAAFTAPTNITIGATASDLDGTVTKVEFFEDGNSLGTKLAAPYTVTWSNVYFGGAHQLTAVATDNAGKTATSAVVNITVAGPIPPTVAITNPPNYASFAAGANVVLGAVAGDSDGTVTNVEFYANTTNRLGNATGSPYNFTWTNVADGSYVLTAVATDNDGLRATSAPVNITVIQLAVSQWVAYNDQGGVGNANDTAYTIASLGTSSGSLKNIDTGGTLTPTLQITNTPGPDAAGTMSAPAAGTPAAIIFGSYIDWTTSNPGVHIYPTNTVGYVFANLDASRRYKLVATGIRGGAPGGTSGTVPNYYSNRWSRAELVGALSYVPAHSANVITSNQYPGALAGSQAAWNAGVNNDTGDVIEWDNIAPGPGNQFVVMVTKYSGPFPNGGNAGDGQDSYAFSAIRLEEFAISGPRIVISSPTNNALVVLPPSPVISATVAGFSGPVTNVAFYAGTTKLGDAPTSPYTITWGSATPGQYTLTAVARDNGGISATSPPVKITVQSNVPPVVAILGPADGTVLPPPADILVSVSATDSDDTVTNVDLLVNGTIIGRSALPPYNFLWSGVPQGIYNLSAIATDDHGAASTSSVVRVFVVPSTAPTVVSFDPAPGTVSSLTQVTVTFTEPVDGVVASDLLVNGVPATNVVGSEAVYTFFFPSPMEGSVWVSWDPNQGIMDRENPPKPFDGTQTNEVAHYTVLDTRAPVVTLINPIPGATLPALTSVEVTFSEPVGGVDQDYLLINGVPATNVSGSVAGPYRFEFAQPANGLVQITWATNQTIHDFAAVSNRFAGTNWSYTLDTSGAETNVIISEFMYHPPPEVPEDVRFEWIELHNKGGRAVNLLGWQLAKAVKYAFTNTTIPAGGYLVVAANVAAFKSRYPSVTNVVGDWLGALSNNEDEMRLHNAAGDLIDRVSYGSQGDWSVRLRGKGERQVTSLTRSGSTVTAFVFGHDMNNGDTVKISGATQTEYNGTFTIGSVTPSTFTYTISGTPATPATGASIICRWQIDLGYSGWAWSSKADGLGRSMELRNENLPNKYGQNWAASQAMNGTPGQPNSVATNNVPPMILELQHSPLVPHSNDTITVTARLLDEHTNGLTANLYYRSVSPMTPGSWSSVTMYDDSLHGDGLANDGVFGGQIPAQPEGTVIEFYVEAVDLEGNRRTYPAAALDFNDNPIQQANALFQVDSDPRNNYAGTQPVYRLIMSTAETNELRQAQINNNFCDATENATFISIDGVESLCVYNTGVRNRGAGTRSAVPMNYRVAFPNDKLWKGQRGIHLNTQYTQSQLAGYALSIRSGIDTEYARIVKVRVNGNDLASAGSPQYGCYIQLEDTDSLYAAGHWPDDSNGNLYRGSKYPWDANLDYWGTNPSTYEGLAGKGYFKNSNVSQNDWTDLFNLCALINTNAADDAVYAQAVRQIVNVDQWMRDIAVFQLAGSGETALQTGMGDDYAMYCGFNDPRFILLAHDLDTILRDATGTAINAPLFRMCPALNITVNGQSGVNVTAFNRFMRHPEFAPIYYQHLNDLMNTSFSNQQLYRTLDEALGDWVPSGVVASMKTWGSNRTAWVRTQIPLNLAVNHALSVLNGYPSTASPTVTLFGVANAINTRSVKVNGYPAAWTAWLATWTNTSVALQPGINRVLVQAFDATGKEIDQRALDVWYSGGAGTTVAGGTLTGTTTWSPASGPYNVTGSLTVGNGATLTIQPGTTVYLGSGVNLAVADGGRLLAEGTAAARIRFTRTPGTATYWGNLTVNGIVGSPETRIAYADFEFNANNTGIPCLEVAAGTVTLDHLTFGNTGAPYIHVDGASFVISDCFFPAPTGSFEPLHGTGGVKSGGRGIFIRNFVGAPNGYNDAFDFTGGNRPGQPIVQFINNVFMGSGDDELDLDGTDAWVEGNIFLHSHRNGSPDTSSGVSGGSNGSDTSEITIIGNIFYDCDHAAMAKEGNFFTLYNNTMVHQTHVGGQDPIGAFVCLEDGGVPEARGMYLEGNIVYDAEQLTQNVTTAIVTFSNNLMSIPWTGLGGNNSTNDPLLKYIPQVAETYFTNWQQAQVMWDWFKPQAGSPALGTGPNGRDKGAVIPYGVSISGEPNGVTSQDNATLIVGINRTGNGIPTAGWPNGSGYTHYKWRLDAGAWSAETPLATPIVLTGLANGPHHVEAIGKNDAGLYQNDPALGADAVVTLSRTWIVDANYAKPGVRLNEILASNQRAVPVDGKYPDMIELYNASSATVDLYGMSITDNKGDPRKYVFPPGTYLAASNYLVLYADNDASPPGIHLGFGLKQDGDDLYLFAANGRLLDSVSFGMQVTDLSIGRLADGHWALTYPTFGANNTAAFLGDPYKLKINEWLTHGGGAFPDDFVELYNPDPRPVSLGGLYLTDNAIGAPDQDEIAALSFIPGGGYAVFLADGNAGGGPNHLNFRLSSDRGSIALFDHNLLLIDFVLYGPQTTGVSQGRSPDGSYTLAFFTTPTPGAPNARPLPPLGTQLVLNEVLAKNINGLTNFDGTTPEWIELYNPTANSINLLGMSLSDATDTPRKYVFPSVVIPSGGYRVVLCDASQPASTNNVTWLNSGFGIKANGGSVYLFDGTTNEIDFVTYGVQAADYSIGRDPYANSNWVLNLPSPGGVNLAAGLGDQMQLHVNEWMANPASGGKWFEIYNPNAQPVRLSGLTLRDSSHNFAIASLSFIGTELYGYERFWADKNSGAGADHVDFGISAAGDALGIFTTNGVQIDWLTFGPQTVGVSEGRLPDGSANRVFFPTTPTPADANYLPLTSIVINEVLTATANPALEQAIELYNPGDSPVNIGGWYLSNQKRTLAKFRIPNGTTIQPGEFKVFYQADFCFDPRDPASFLLDAVNGDSVWLATADTNGMLTGYRTMVDFGPAEPDVSFGRYTNSVGAVDFVALSQRTFGTDDPASVQEFRTGTGAPNAYPKVGPVVFSQIMYHPPDIGGLDNVRDEFIELLNITTNTVPLYDPAYPTNTWHLREGVDFDFPPNVSLAPGGNVLVVSFDPVNDTNSLAAFLATYRLSRCTPSYMYGPYAGKLNNGGEGLKLLKPGAPVPPGQLSAGTVPRIVAERVVYGDQPPWDPAADGLGNSLQRLDPLQYGNDPANWRAAAPVAAPLTLDCDHDGMPDWWEIKYGFNPDDPSDANQDADGDGLTNLQEYLAGTDPRNPQSELWVGITTGHSASLTFMPMAGRSYTIEYRDSLTEGTWQRLVDIPAVASPPPEGITVTDPNPGATRFYRIRTPQLAP